MHPRSGLWAPQNCSACGQVVLLVPAGALNIAERVPLLIVLIEKRFWYQLYFCQLGIRRHKQTNPVPGDFLLLSIRTMSCVRIRQPKNTALSYCRLILAL